MFTRKLLRTSKKFGTSKLKDFSELLGKSEIDYCKSFSTSKHVSAIPTQSPMYIFDRKAKCFQRERAANNPNVNVYDYLKDEVGYRLADRIFDIKRKFTKALDSGCGRGHVSKHVLNESVEELVMTDMCSGWLKQAQCTEGVKVEKKILDEENFSLEAESLDLIISCLSLHWVNNLPGCLDCVMSSLKKDGVFIAAIFGGDTLYELRGSLQLAEQEREGGISPHISPFTELKDVAGLLTRSGFTMLTIDTDEIVIGYPSMFELMWDLKGMGENNAAKNRKLHLKRETMLAASAIYSQLYGKTKEDGEKYIPATFQVIYMLGWKPHESQPKPLDRGTGEISLKDLYRLDEIVKKTTKVKLTDEDK